MNTTPMNECAQAEACFLNGDLIGAEAHYIRAIKDGGAEPFIGLGATALERGDTYAARRLFDKAYTIEPTDRAVCGMGLVCMKEGHYSEAYKKFSEALDIYPCNRSALNGLIDAGFALDFIAELPERIEAALALGIEGDEFYIALAKCQIALGRDEMARELLENRMERLAA